MRTCCWLLLAISCCHSGQGAIVLGLASPASSGGAEPIATHLFEIGLDGSDYLDLGPIQLNGGPAEFDALAANHLGQVFAFQMTPAGSRLVSIDPTQAVASLLAPPLFGREVRGATSGANSDLWAIDSAADELLLVSMTTGEELSAVALTLDNGPFDLPPQSDVAVDFSGQLVLTAGNQIFALDAQSGQLTLLFTDEAGEANPPSPEPPSMIGAAVGMAPTEQLIALDAQGVLADDLYTYDAANGFARTLLAAAPIAFDVALGDLTVLHQPVSSGDYNGDGTVDLADYTVWRDTLGSTTQLAANGDDFGTSMNRIDAADYLVWKASFAAAASAGTVLAASGQVPEASTATIAGGLALLLAGADWHRRVGRRTRPKLGTHDAC